MPKLTGILVVLSALAFLSCLAVGCDSACKELGSRVCHCQPSRSLEERCEIAIDAAYQNREPSDGEEDDCQSILDQGTCTCEAILADNLAACGLANDAASAWTD